MWWFEAGGKRIGRLDIQTTLEGDDTPVWKLVGQAKFDFNDHTIKVVTEKHGVFVIGGTGKHNCF